MNEVIHDSETGARKPSTLFKIVSAAFRLVLTIVVVSLTIGIIYYWLTNRPRTERRPPRPVSVLVQVEPVRVGTQQIVVRGMGTVVPATMIQIAARVTGQITEVSEAFTPGGRFKTDEILLQVDKRDYELAVSQQSANVTRAEADVRIEMGQQSVARSEYELLMGSIEPPDLDLLLRRPQLAAREAALAITESTLEKAKLDLERTVIRAPFNATVVTRNVDLGAYVAPGASLATLAETDLFWIEVSLPVSELQWIDIPTQLDDIGSPVRVYQESAWGLGEYREGYVQRLLPDLEPRGRMARLLVAVEDPLNLNSAREQNHALLLGSFVRVEIDGKEIDNVVRIPRTYVHEGDTVWVMTQDNTLDIKETTIVWGAGDEVFVTDGLAEGELLVTSALGAPVPGMLLRTESMGGNASESGQAQDDES